jgi:hypothetical protein
LNTIKRFFELYCSHALSDEDRLSALDARLATAPAHSRCASPYCLRVTVK